MAHSIGPAFALSLLEKHKALACFFVSGFDEFYKLDPAYDKVNRSFVDRKFKWEVIKQNCNNFFLYHGDDDPYVPLKYAKDLAKKLKGKLTIIPKGKHLNAENGITEFPLLLSDIKKFIKSQK